MRAHQHSDTSRRRKLAFWSGYFVLVVALLSPIHSIGEDWFSVHMVQHLLLTLVAAPLLLLANSMPVMMWSLPREERAGVAAIFIRPGPVRSTLRWLTLPWVAWVLFLLGQWLWHQPVAYDLAAENRWVHYAEHLTFFLTAVFFWWPVVGAAPLGSQLSYPARLLYTFLAWIPNSILGAGLTLAPEPLFQHYVAAAARIGYDAKQDQAIAGLIMWVPGDFLFLGILLILVAGLFREEERKAARLDRELDEAESLAASGSDSGVVQHPGVLPAITDSTASDGSTATRPTA